ncbi:MAG TPA: porin family protein [Gillisia sp.]|nr:porin family protein [Gillisia sp.]
MKKALLIISLTILTLTAVQSQEKIQYGVKGGVNLINMTSDFIYDKVDKTGFYIGGLAEIPFGNKFSLQPEILYSTHGAKGKEFVLATPYAGAPATAPYYGEYKRSYIQVPILVKFYLFKNLSFELGPSFNFLTRDKKITTHTDSSNNYYSFNNSGFAEKFEFSGVIGVSYKLEGGIFGSLRYVNGFTAALDRGSYLEDVKNVGFQLGVGFLF